jgi:hypothetical protein
MGELPDLIAFCDPNYRLEWEYRLLLYYQNNQEHVSPGIKPQGNFRVKKIR